MLLFLQHNYMNMKGITKYDFYKTKYGDELLIDVVMLKDTKKYLLDAPLHFLSYYDISIITEGEGLFKIENDIHTVKAADVLFTLPHQFRCGIQKIPSTDML